MLRDRLSDLKQNYWDYLCAVDNWNKILSITDYQKIDGKPSYIQRANRELSFLDHCQFSYSQKPISPVDKRCLHFKIQAPKEWYVTMDQEGFKVATLGDAYGTSEQFVQTGIAVSNDKPLKDSFILIDPHIALQYNGKERQNSTFSAELRPFWTFLDRFISICAVHKIDMSQDSESLKNCSRSLYAKRLYVEDVQLATKYLNLTLCPLVENLRRYDQNRKGISFFDQATAQELKDQDERVLWSIAKLRDVYLAHNQHFPFAVPTSNRPHDFSAVMSHNAVDYNKIFEVLGKTVPKILGFKNQEEAVNHLQSEFPNLTVHTVGEIPLCYFLTSYINSTLLFNDSFEQLFTKKSKRHDFDFILEKCGVLRPERQWFLAKNKGPTHHRNLVLHERIPVMEIMGIKDKAQITNKEGKFYASWPMPKNILEQKNTIDRITTCLLTSYHNNNHIQIMNTLQAKRNQRG